jgi:hypothetical protein
VTIFALDYAVLLIVLLITVYNGLRAPRDDRNGDREMTRMAEKRGRLKGNDLPG